MRPVGGADRRPQVGRIAPADAVGGPPDELPATLPGAADLVAHQVGPVRQPADHRHPRAQGRIVGGDHVAQRRPGHPVGGDRLDQCLAVRRLLGLVGDVQHQPAVPGDGELRLPQPAGVGGGGHGAELAPAPAVVGAGPDRQRHPTVDGLLADRRRPEQGPGGQLPDRPRQLVQGGAAQTLPGVRVDDRTDPVEAATVIGAGEDRPDPVPAGEGHHAGDDRAVGGAGVLQPDHPRIQRHPSISRVPFSALPGGRRIGGGGLQAGDQQHARDQRGQQGSQGRRCRTRRAGTGRGWMGCGWMGCGWTGCGWTGRRHGVLLAIGSDLAAAVQHRSLQRWKTLETRRAPVSDGRRSR